MRYRPLFFCLVILLATKAYCQTPTITHVDKYINGNGQTVTISGSNFGTTAGNLVVWFGAAYGDIQNVTEQTIEVKPPAGATYESIVVTNTSTGKSARSSGEFLLSYGGESPISLSNFLAQGDLDAETGLYDLCMCDLDGDGLSDVTGSNSGGVTAPLNGLSVFRNTTVAPGTFSFASKMSFLSSTKLQNIKCADLNNDGKKELIVTEADPGTSIFILKNASTPGSLSFTTQNISIPGTSPKRVDVADLDQDGLPEIVVTDQNTANKDFLILPNTSAGATISFDVPISLLVPTTGSDGLAIQDVDGDNKSDIIISHFLSSSGNVFVYKNKSHPGTFEFGEAIKADVAPESPANTGAPINVRLADINGDSKPDIVVTHFFGSRISVQLNQSTSTEIKFGAATSIATDPYPFGLDVGDLDGDGKPDVVVASLIGPAPNTKSLTILNNTSTAGAVSFTRLTQATTFINRNIVVGDIDGDSKPDIAYTSVDDNTNGIPASKISFFRNKSCIVPKITPDGSIVVCSSFPLTLEATKSLGATYVWKESGTPEGTTTQTFTPSLSGNYTVDITSDGCTRGSNTVVITVGTGSAATPTITNTTPELCEGGTISLSVTPVGGETYNWKGPEGFTATGASVTRPSYVATFAGRYELEVINNGCLAATASTLVETISLPSFNVNFTGSDVICTGDTKLLTAQPNDANFTYQWADEGGNIGGATSATFSVNATGSYYVKAKSVLYPACPEVEAEAVDILLATIPTATFQSPAETCKDVVTSFTNQSVAQENATPAYKWEFGDSGTSTDKNATHTYTAIAPSLTVKLTVSYRGDACATTATKQIKVSAPPTATITTPGGVFEICDGESITLAVSDTFSEYKWGPNGETTPTIEATEDATYSVQLKNSIGCKITVSHKVDIKPAPNISITAEKNPINLGEETKLSATAGFAAYEWTPVDGLDDATSQTPIAKPTLPTEYTVTVVGENGCPGSAKLLLDVILDNPTNLLQISNFFSPNGDDTNPFWTVKPDVIVQKCGVTIFDEKGVKVFDAKPYNNDWDGTSNGKKLPDGVYYYVIRCDGDSASKSGSITILR